MKQSLFFLLIALILISCDGDSSAEFDLEMENYIIPIYSDFDDLNEKLKNRLNRSVNSNGRVEEKKYQTFEEVYQEVLILLDTVTDEEDHNRILEEYDDVIWLDGDTYKPRITNDFYRLLTNRRGMFISNGFFHRVIDEEYIAATNNPDLVDELLELTDVSKVMSKEIELLPYAGDAITNSNSRITAACSYPEEVAGYFKNASGCKNDRKLFIKALVTFTVSASSSGNHNYAPYFGAVVYGQRRTGTFCKWKDYSTRLGARNASFNITYNNTSVPQTKHISFPNYNGTIEEPSRILYSDEIGSFIKTSPSSISIEISNGYWEGTSRGIDYGVNWAVMNCN